MRRALTAFGCFAALVLLLIPAAAASRPELWLVPDPGSVDLPRMFEHPEEWAHVLQLIDVFQFTEDHTRPDSTLVNGSNTYNVLAGVDAFHKVNVWGKTLALGVAAVKPFYCTPDESGMNESIGATLSALQAISAAGGTVAYAVMDEPFLSGQFPQCGGPALQPTADRLQQYIGTVRGTYPAIKVGMVEAYPSFAPSQFGLMLDLMQARGDLPAFLQLDVDLRAVRPPHNFAIDVSAIRGIAAAHGVPFGIVLWGYNGDADALFTFDLDALADAYRQVFPTWSTLPEELNVQSWAQSSTGLYVTPSNLPESRSYTLTNTFWQTYRRFIGETSGVSNGTAVPRK